MAQTVRVGILNDMSDGPHGVGDVTEWLKREIDAVRATGRLDADVEFVYSYGLGLPAGTGEAVERAYGELAAQDVVLIVGPAIGDNALIATPLAKEHRIPTINWAGAERARGEYMFHQQVGSHEDESLVMARCLQKLAANRLGVVYDISPIGERHLEYLEDEAAILGQEIVRSIGISPLAEDAGAEVREVLENDPDGFVYLGLGLSAPAVASALSTSGWQGPRIMNTAGIRGYHGDFAATCDGWFYIDMYSDGNQTLKALCEDMGLPPQDMLSAAKGYDLGRLVAEGLARAKEFSTEGLRKGLEQIKWLPSAEGEEGTLLGFGIQDRGALHGRYLVVRQWLDGETHEVKPI